jgi:CheY-like chemotaxis protein
MLKKMNKTVPKSLRILVVEDDAAVLATTLEMLEALGHWATGVQSAESAKSRYIDGAFDVLLIDIGLPALSGLDFFEALNARPGLKVIFATGRARPEKLVPGTVWLQKPFGFQELESVLQGAACTA